MKGVMIFLGKTKIRAIHIILVPIAQNREPSAPQTMVLTKRIATLGRE